MTTINHTPAGEQGAKKRLIHRFSWVSLLVCWLIWVLNAYDREMILRLGPVISKEFSLSPEQWGNVVALIMVALAVLDIPGAIWSDRYGSGWKRARFQVPLVLGYTALSFISGIKAISHGLTAFVLLRVGVNLGAGWGEPVGVSNTAEWWPKEKRGFALGVHHTGYPIGALLSGVVASLVLSAFGEGSWRYCFLLALIVAIPLMIFWAKYSTADRINTLYQHIDSQGMTRPATQESSHVAKGEGMKTFLRTLRNRNISLTAGNTLLTQIVYMGINVVLPPYLYHVSGLSLAASAGLSIIFTLTGTLGQIIWPWLSDSFGRKRTLIVCGLWMSIGIALVLFRHQYTASYRHSAIFWPGGQRRVAYLLRNGLGLRRRTRHLYRQRNYHHGDVYRRRHFAIAYGLAHPVWRGMGKSGGLYLRLLYHGGMCAAGDVVAAHDHR